MKLPRNITGVELVKLLGKYGYHTTRQTGSHIRMTTTIKNIEHHITIPYHNPLRVGTLSKILKEIAIYLETDINSLIEELFR